MNSKAGRNQLPEFQTKQPSGVNWLLVIAIDEYDPAIGKLYNCVKDVRAFTEVVTQRYHFDTKHIIPLINADATAEGIEAAFRKLLTIKPEDNLVIYYSGHGDYDNDIDLGYWIPADATNRRQGLHNDFITRFLNRIPSRHTLLLCDSCFSGSLLLDEPTKVISPRYYTQPSRWAITSGARELVSDGKEHSPFAKALLSVLTESSGDVDIVTLGRAIMEEVAANERQKPLFAPMRVSGHQGGMFVFFKKQDETRDWEAAQQENTIAAYTRFRRTYANSTYFAEAKQKIKALEEEADWQKALRRNKVSDYEDYLDDYPNGIHADEAHQKIDALLKGNVLKPARVQSDVITPSDDITIPEPQIITPKEEKKIITPHIRTFEVEPEMIFVKGGTFLMGSNENDAEKPIHEVMVKDFYIGKHPVTVAQFQAFIEATNYKTDAHKIGSSYIITASEFKEKAGVNWRFDVKGERHPENNYNHPVIHVSWNDAVAYCKWLSTETGKKYLLPSEAEWEYAARGGNKSKDYIYAGSDELDRVGWYWENSGNNKIAGDWKIEKLFENNCRTHPVGGKDPNELGIYDMSGNVWEWCEDVWHDNYEGAPQDGSAWMIAGEQARRVVRGGSWYDLDDDCRVSLRLRLIADFRDYSIGFRLAGY